MEAENANKRREVERIALMKELNYANLELEKLKVSKSQTEKALAEQMRENEVIRLAKDKLSAQYDADVPVSPAKSKDAEDTPYKSQKSKVVILFVYIMWVSQMETLILVYIVIYLLKGC